MSTTKKSLRGEELNQAIESELQQMLSEGYELSPITPKNLHDRVKTLGFVNCGLSVLSSTKRKKLIEHYRRIQIQRSGLSAETKAVASSNQTSLAMRKIIAEKNQEISDLKEQLEMNYAVLTEIVQAVELSGCASIEGLLSKSLLKISNQ